MPLDDARALLGTFAPYATDADLKRLSTELAACKKGEKQELIKAYKKLLRNRRGVVEATPAAPTPGKASGTARAGGDLPQPNPEPDSKAKSEPLPTGTNLEDDEFELESLF